MYHVMYAYPSGVRKATDRVIHIDICIYIIYSSLGVRNLAYPIYIYIYVYNIYILEICQEQN